MRKIHQNISAKFEPEEWAVTERFFSPDTNCVNETIFSVANGYLGVRGMFEEGFYGDPQFTDPAVMINGIYEYYDYHHLWKRPGFPERSHNIVRQVNPVELFLCVDGDPVDLKGNIENYSRRLNMRDGTVTRTFDFITGENKRVSLCFIRFASQTDKHLLGIRVSVTASEDCSVTVTSRLSDILSPYVDPRQPVQSLQKGTFEKGRLRRKGKTLQVTYRTKRSGFVISSAFTERLPGAEMREKDSDDALCNEYTLALTKGKSVVYERIAGFATMRDFDDFEDVLAQKTSSTDYHTLYAATAEYWRKFWSVADIRIEGDTLVQQGIRFSIFHVNQSAGKDGITNISANGLTGVVYSGHTFWDTEVFIMPMFWYTFPETAKQLLIYRYNILDKARERAAQMDEVGALYAWNSINGEECGTVFEASTAEYHINNAVFYAIYRYVEATGDVDFLVDYGAEMLFETARCLAHRGNFIEAKGGKFCINVVCGPDEYTPIVDNNCYTNYLTRKHLYYSLETAEFLKKKFPEKFAELSGKCRLTEEELSLWKRAADNMYLPYNSEYGMYMQDDQFMYRDPVDLDALDPNRMPLLFHYHPLNLWRMQVCKQADLVLLMFLFGNEFTQEMKKKIFDYMEPRTLHESSLSAGIHAIVACDIGYGDEAYGFLKQSSRMDLDDYNRNACNGVHAACMGSAWMMIVNGYAGLRVYDNTLHFKPIIADGWKSYSFRLRFRGAIVGVYITPEEARYTLIEGDSVQIESGETAATLNERDKSISVRLASLKN